MLNFLVRLSRVGPEVERGVTSHVYATLLQDTRRLCPRPTAVPSASALNSWQWPEDDANLFLDVMDHLWITKQHDHITALAAAMDFSLPLGQVQNFWEVSSVKVTSFITEFVLRLKRYDDNSLTCAGKGVVLSALREHAIWVASKEPKNPKNWTRPSVSCNRGSGSNCTECATLNLFLQNPGLVSTRFTLNKQKREHVQRALNCKWYTFDTTFLGQGQAHTLIVTKTNNEYEENLASWQARLDGYRASLQKLHVDFVEQMLGPESYRQLILLELRPGSDLPSAAPGASRQPLASSITAGRQAAAVPAQVAGVKRKLEIIDLCGDE
jgi:hypothetical protein